MGYLNQLASCLKNLCCDNHVAVVTVNNTEEISVENNTLEQSECTESVPALAT